MIISIKEIRNFFICVLIPLLVGYTSFIISELMVKGDISIAYSQLIKPSFAPPSYIFKIVWTILYILMGISCYIISKKGLDLFKVRDALFYYWLQLVLNFSWAILFFGLNLRLTSLVTILVMIVIIATMIIKFYKLSKAASYLNIAYLIWLGYATFFNYFIWIINK